MAAADLDGDGTLNYDEFIAATANLSKLEREANILSAFKQFDSDHSGALSKSEVMAALTSMGSTEQEIEVSSQEDPQCRSCNVVDASESVALRDVTVFAIRAACLMSRALSPEGQHP